MARDYLKEAKNPKLIHSRNLAYDEDPVMRDWRLKNPEAWAKAEEAHDKEHQQKYWKQ